MIDRSGRGNAGRPGTGGVAGRPAAKKLSPAQRAAIDRIDADIKRLRAARRARKV